MNRGGCRPSHIAHIRAWREVQPNFYGDCVRAWMERNPEKARAHRLFREAVRAGAVVRKSECEACHCRHAPIHAHHDDYSKPLEVIYLCPTCHRRRHRHMRGVFYAFESAAA